MHHSTEHKKTKYTTQKSL